jgi:hypothetical protein
MVNEFNQERIPDNAKHESVPSESRQHDMTNNLNQEQSGLTTAQIARRAETVQSANADTSGARAAMFPGNETESFRSRWHDIQAGFVDSPRESVQKADELVAAVIQRLAEVFSTERGKLESDWGEGRDISTEDLRQALQRYRSFFDRLLSV